MKTDFAELTDSEIQALSDTELDKAIEAIETQAGAAIKLQFRDKGKDHAVSMSNSDGGKLMMLAASFHSEKNRRAIR